MMKKIYVHNLNILITDNCNLSCINCKCGNKGNYVINDETIENLFDQVDIIDTLIIDGGEPLLYPDRIYKIFKTIIKKNVIVKDFCIKTNGTMYTEYIEKICRLFESYIRNNNNMFDEKIEYPGYINYSCDYFHGEALKRVKNVNLDLFFKYIENIKELKEKSGSRLNFIREIPVNLINEGNAKMISDNGLEKIKQIVQNSPFTKSKLAALYAKKVELSPMKTYIYENEKKVYIGPYVTIGKNGIITELNASNDRQGAEFNYGTVNDGLLNVLKKYCTNFDDYEEYKIGIQSEEEKYQTKGLVYTYEQ